MTLRVALLIGGAVTVAGAGLAIWFMGSHQSEVLVSAGLALKSEWQEIRPAEGMRTTADWSELLLEVPSLRFGGVGDRLVLEDGTSVHVEGYLTTYTGERINLDQVSAVGYGGGTFVRLSSPMLEWKQRGYRFRSVTLRSNSALQTGKVIWMSYDPRATKGGVAFPRALR